MSRLLALASLALLCSSLDGRAAASAAEVPAWACALSEQRAGAAVTPLMGGAAAQGVVRLHHFDKSTSGAKGSNVTAVNSTSLTSLLKEHAKDVLITFYAPWCPHCRDFVLADPSPLERLSQQLLALDGPKVLTFDVEKSPPPQGFEVDYVPKIYLVPKTGAPVAYKADPHDLEKLQAFALGDAPINASNKEVDTIVLSTVGQTRPRNLRMSSNV
mmetsp:Transcript_102930/g.220126  ORF Transcript_102930/g.220126 Transcript_102930/m.220126 type:complete len:215 (+) Transcript_102930:79-723(+)